MLARAAAAIFVEIHDGRVDPGGDNLLVALAGQDTVIFDNRQRHIYRLSAPARLSLSSRDKILDTSLKSIGLNGITLRRIHAGHHLLTAGGEAVDDRRHLRRAATVVGKTLA